MQRRLQSRPRSFFVRVHVGGVCASATMSGREDGRDVHEHARIALGGDTRPGVVVRATWTPLLVQAPGGVPLQASDRDHRPHRPTRCSRCTPALPDPLAPALFAQPRPIHSPRSPLSTFARRFPEISPMAPLVCSPLLPLLSPCRGLRHPLFSSLAPLPDGNLLSQRLTSRV